MCDSGTPVWVLVGEMGSITVYDAPGGNVITPVGSLGPVDSSGNCPAAPFVPEITLLTVTQDACKPADQEQYISWGFTTNIPLGAYQLQAFISGVWTDITAVVPFIGPGAYSDTDVQIIPFEDFVGATSFRVLEVNTGTIGGPAIEVFVTCVVIP